MEWAWELLPFWGDDVFGGLHLLHESDQRKYEELDRALWVSNSVLNEWRRKIGGHYKSPKRVKKFQKKDIALHEMIFQFLPPPVSWDS